MERNKYVDAPFRNIGSCVERRLEEQGAVARRLNRYREQGGTPRRGNATSAPASRVRKRHPRRQTRRIDI